jgi:hypothetical protein
VTVGSALASAAFAVFVLLSAGTFLFGEEQIGTIVGTAGIFMSVFEIAHQRDGGKSALAVVGGPEQPFHFPAEQGLIGGLFGGVIAGLIIAIVYDLALPQNIPWMVAHHHPVPTFWDLLTPILIGSGLIGAVVGLLSLGLAELFGHLARPAILLLINKFTGGVIGGLIAGLITGPLGSLYFGSIQWPVLLPGQMLSGALPAAGLLVFAILYFGRAQFSGVIWRGLVVTTIATLLVAGLAAVVMKTFEAEILALLQRYIVEGGRVNLLTGGLYYGAFVGTLLGAVVGLTLLLAPPAKTAPPH